MTHFPKRLGIGPGAMLALMLMVPVSVQAQTGVDDDRVSLPEGPGSLEGVGDNVEIDPNMGMMRWNIPIDAPRGFPGLTPGLSLSYSSGSGSGVVGIGWSMAVPVIERMTSKGVPGYDTEDFFAMEGGDELVHVATEGGDRVYRERFEKDFVRYTWVGVGDGAEGHWKAEFPDGRVGYFGADSGGNTVASARTSHPDGGTWRYHLVETVDPYGHRIRYGYDSFDGNRPLLTNVSYVFVDGDAQYSVQLDYEERPDLISDCAGGFEEVLQYRLTNARALSGGEVIREYVLDYEDVAQSGGASRLRATRKFGLGGADEGELYPIVFSFGYSKGLGVECAEGDEGCDRPFLVDMGTAAPLGTGDATLVDINGDALPDILDSSQNGPHRFFVNRLTPNNQGGFDHTFDPSFDSATITNAANFRLGDQNIQTLDINGDGFSDIFNTVTGNVLFNGGDGDWLPGEEEAGAVPEFSGPQFANMRFMDFDNDKRIDVIQSTPDQTRVFRNNGDTFDPIIVDTIGAGFAGGDLQLADMNGDGLNDPVQVLEGGNIRFRLNLGLGKWGPFQTIPGVGVQPAEQDFVELEDLNGDGLSDVVIVVGTTIKYALNRNANNFDPFVTIDSDDIDGNIPAREGGVTVLFADMNGNGSEDVVWIDNGGRVQYLELFPVRPNLISRIDNGIGMVQKITYGTSVEHAARAEAAGEPWDVTLPNAMAVVDKIDLFVTLTGDEDGSGVHEVIDYTYRNGFYDGKEKQFRGFTDVVTVLRGDAFQEEGTTHFFYDNGLEDPYKNGLLLRQIFESDDRVLNELSTEYGDCPVAEVPNNVEPAVRHICTLSQTTLVKEGADPSAWVMLRTETDYDGYGNATLTVDHGVIERGGQPCGADCEGDEQYSETDFVEPTNIWILGSPSRSQTYTDPSDPFKTDTRYFYDGEPFEGLAEGELTHGFLTRQTDAVSANETITKRRARRDEHGNTVEIFGANGDPSEPNAHRRTTDYDDSGIFLIGSSLHLTDPTGQPYQLRKEYRYEPQFQKLIEATDNMIVQDGEAISPRNSRRWRYDGFGRVAAIVEAGDDLNAPTQEFVYELADPVSRVTFRSRSTSGGPLDETFFRCFDGKGRKIQDRLQLDTGEYQVLGFEVFNNQGAVVESFQPFTSDSGDCDTSPPTDVASTRTKYDASGRVREVTAPDADIYGNASIARTDYLPLVQMTYDREDTDPDSPHFDTPTVTVTDGLGRTIASERTINTEGDGIQTARFLIEYDNIGNLAQITDPEDNVHTQTFDRLGRAIEIDAPNTGTTTIAYDDAGNAISRTDARGITVISEYDGANRRTARFDEDNREETLSTWRYDQDPDCPLQECTNLPGRLASTRYPLGNLAQGTDRMGYNVRGLSVFKARDFGAISLVTTMAYDNRSRLIRRTHPDGTEFETSYDKAGRVVAQSGAIDAINYEERGLISEVSFANGAGQRWTYDSLKRTSTLESFNGAGTVFEARRFTFNRVGNIEAITDLGDSGAGLPRLDVSIVHDDWYRPLEMELSVGTADAETLETRYGFIDQILSRTSSLGAVSPAHAGEYTYGADQPMAATQVGELSIAYDAAGNATQRGSATMVWDHIGRLTRSDNAEGEGFGAVYNHGEKRVIKRDGDSVVFYGHSGFEVRDGIGTAYVRVGNIRAVRHQSTDFGPAIYPDTDGDGAITAHDARAQAEEGGDDGFFNAEQMLAASAARLLAENEDVRAFLHWDHLGTITAATDEGGEVRGQRRYYPYGQLRASQGFVDAHGFTGQERDGATGLVHFQFRYLDTFTGRWASADPAFNIVTADTIERIVEANGAYGYVTNNPIDTIDPLGLKKKSASKKIDKKVGKKIRKAGRKLGNLLLDTHKNVGNGASPNAMRVEPSVRRQNQTPAQIKAAKAAQVAKQKASGNKKASVLLGLGTFAALSGAGITGVIVGLDLAMGAPGDEEDDPDTPKEDDDFIVLDTNNQDGLGDTGQTPEVEQLIITNSDSNGTVLTESSGDDFSTGSTNTGSSSNPELNIRF